jgi:hypothetical protein
VVFKPFFEMMADKFWTIVGSDSGGLPILFDPLIQQPCYHTGIHRKPDCNAKAQPAKRIYRIEAAYLTT